MKARAILASILVLSIGAVACDGGKQCAEPGSPCGEGMCCAAPYSCAGGSCLIAERPSCDGVAQSNLPGVSLLFPNDRCSYTRAEVAGGITIYYAVDVERNLDGIHPRPLDMGSCGKPDVSGLIVGFEITGNTQDRYCLCDVGPCMAQTFSTRALVGRYPGAIAWDGRNWLGPSDTGNAEGAAFPPGKYTLTVTAKGTWDGSAACDASVCSPDASAVLDYQVVAQRFITITE